MVAPPRQSDQDFSAPIARRGIKDSQKLGQHRRLVERTFAWINRVRSLAI
jgi:hypothetical protein